LVVIDCGSAGLAAPHVLDAATHIIWTVTADLAAVARARQLMASDALPTPRRCGEVLVAAARDAGARVSVRALRRLAAQRCERLVLAPHSDELARGDFTDAPAALGRTLAGIGHLLRTER